ncbi:Hypothetical predicted protein [Octopus vulgaris]|uniref:Uncharacterized protein n=1 Tax=Octopus vulgaris TaxID=6645 RepID=A0AA36B3I4_OCTVU|nr:Hypothetical predicted protein [Octopus vulgaris]
MRLGMISFFYVVGKNSRGYQCGKSQTQPPFFIIHCGLVPQTVHYLIPSFQSLSLASLFSVHPDSEDRGVTNILEEKLLNQLKCRTKHFLRIKTGDISRIADSGKSLRKTTL